MENTGYTIQDTLEDIHHRELVLPAIQREFVWKPNQIYSLFDSLMQEYPFGTFLHWKIRRENSHKFKFYEFVRDYHEKDGAECRPLATIRDRPLTAVLDGQQRLTALNIGLYGSMALKLKYKSRTNPNAYPTSKLHIDLLWIADEDSTDGTKYRFRFLTEKQLKILTNRESYWFPVHRVLEFEDGGPAMSRWLEKELGQEQLTQAHVPLYKLFKIVRETKLIVSYEERGQNLEKVLQIFIRMNEGGTKLTHSDLLFSVAVAQWNHDAREEITRLVKDLNKIGSNGFNFSKDLVLKAGLMLSDISSVRFKGDNFNRNNMREFEQNWNNIKRILILTVQLVSKFGFSSDNLHAHNAILPIAYYLKRRNFNDTYLPPRTNHAEDRKSVHKWLIQSLLKKGTWGSGTDTLLAALRQSIIESAGDKFPTAQIQATMARQGKSLVFEKEELEGLVNLEYGNSLTFALLSLIFPFIDLTGKFHVDHIFPKSRFTRRQLLEAKVPEDKVDEYIRKKDGLANLQLLAGESNSEKSKKMPTVWLSEAYTDPKNQQEYIANHLLGEVPISIVDFDQFYETRKNQLKEKIRELLGR